MAHSHTEDKNTYYMDQLCTVALSGAMAIACITLYTWRPEILGLMLARAFHSYVLWGGIALLVLTIMRAVSLFLAAGGTAHSHGDASCAGEMHSHDHVHEPGATCCHDHDHVHDHDHAHSHSHEQGIPLGASLASTTNVAAPVLPDAGEQVSSCGHDHDHGWAPWRYAVLLLPIMLYMLRLPNEGFNAAAAGQGPRLDMTQDVAKSCAIFMSASPLQALVFSRDFVGGRVEDLDFKTLEGAAGSEEERQYWRGRSARVRGLFAPQDNNDKMFRLVRFKIQCCAADVIPLRVAIICGEAVSGIQASQWVEVTGQIDFWQMPGANRYMTVLKVPGRKEIKATEPDSNPYVQ